MALQFPDKSGDGENPLVEINNEDNGVTYYWDPASSSWVLVTAQTVTKDYVDGRDQLRYRRDGTDFIYGDFIIRPQSDFAIDPTVVITTTGTLKLADDNKITFSSKSENLPTLSYGEFGNEAPLLVFNSSFIFPQVPFNFNTEVVGKDRVFLIENEGIGVLKLFDIQHATGVSFVKNLIKLPNDKNSSFVVSSEDGATVGLFVKGNNETEIVSNTSTAFVVRSKGTLSQDKYPFTVDTTNHKIYTSKEYSDALKLGGGLVTGPNGTTTYFSFKEENLVATKGYVDAQTREEPGFNICAEREEDAQSGGFWRDGSNLYWKL